MSPCIRSWILNCMPPTDRANIWCGCRYTTEQCRTTWMPTVQTRVAHIYIPIKCSPDYVANDAAFGRHGWCRTCKIVHLNLHLHKKAPFRHDWLQLLFDPIHYGTSVAYKQLCLWKKIVSNPPCYYWDYLVLGGQGNPASPSMLGLCPTDEYRVVIVFD